MFYQKNKRDLLLELPSNIIEMADEISCAHRRTNVFNHLFIKNEKENQWKLNMKK